MKRLLWLSLLFALIMVAIPLFTAVAQDSLPPPLDPQSWVLQRDMTWNDLKPNPVIDWQKDLNPAGLDNKFAAPGKSANSSIVGGFIMFEYLERKFITRGEAGSDPLGFYLFSNDGSGYQNEKTKNPVFDVYGMIAEDMGLSGGRQELIATLSPEELDKKFAQWWVDYLNKPQKINNGVTISEFWSENSYGKWQVELKPFGPFTIPYFEFETRDSYQSYNDVPPSFRTGANGQGARIYVFDTVAQNMAIEKGIPFYELDFFFLVHAGNAESGVWQEFGQLQYPTRKEIPYELGPGPRMKKVEEFFTESPEWLEVYAARYANHYRPAFWSGELAKYNALKAAGTPELYVFKLAQEDWDWVNGYNDLTVKNTRYVDFTSWEAAVSEWSHAGSYDYPGVAGDPTKPARRINRSTQGENSGMSVFAHEFGHISSIADNYGDPWSDQASPATEPWDMMSRGSFGGPFGDHARWTVPGIEASSVPVHMMHRNKNFLQYYQESDILSISVEQLANTTPVVSEVVARNIPLANQYYPALETEYGLKSPNYYKAITLSFGSVASGYNDKAVLQTSGYTWTRKAASLMTVEVVDKTGYDSFNHDHGVLLSRTHTNTGNPSHALIDSHLYNIDMVDFYLNNEPSYYTVAHATQLADATFHAGVSFTDTGYYKGSEFKNDKRISNEVVSGNTVNEFYDPFNKLHFYILAKNTHEGRTLPGKSEPEQFLSYSIGLLHENGTPVGGELEVVLAKIERETPLKVAVASFDITNTGDATDIIRVGVNGYLPGVLLNDLFAVGAGETITVPVYVQLPGDIRTRNFNGQIITLTASSESNGAKIGQASVVVSDLIDYNYNVYLVPDQDGIYAGETVFVDVMLGGGLNYSQISTEIAYDTTLLKYEGYANLQGIVAAVSPLAGKISVRSIPSLNMITGEPCDPAVKIVTLKFSGLGNFSTDKIDTALSLASIVVNPPAGFVGGGTAPGLDLPLTIYENSFVKSFYNNLAIYPEWIGLDDQGLPTTMPLFSYTSDFITERVWVEVPVDTDRDGIRDRVSLWIRRPITKEGFKCPVVMEFSPYHSGTRGYGRMSNYINSEDDFLKGMAESFRYQDNSAVSLSINPDTTHLTYDDIKYKGTEAWDPIWWQSKGAFTVDSWYTGVTPGIVPAATEAGGLGPADTITWGSGSPTPSASGIPARWNHLYVRGYAMVFGQLLGNRDSHGITNTLHVEEWISAAAAAKWFNGEAKAYTTQWGDTEVKANWASGLVAMDGGSYPGTTPIVTAMAGVTGLKAIMPEANVTSWYEYYRSGGALHGPEGYGGEDLNLHSSANFSRMDADFSASSNNNIIPPDGPNFPLTAQRAFVSTQRYMMLGQDRVTADYNVEWDARNLTRGFGEIPSDMGILQTNGQQDWNVMPRHAYMMLQAMRDRFAGNDPEAYGTHKIVSTLTKHAAQTARLVPGKDGVERGMQKWYLMFLDHYLLKLDNHVDELMYDVNIANSITGVIEGFEYDSAVEERGTIIPGAHYQNIYLSPATAGKAGRLSYNAPTSAIEHFEDMNMEGQINAPQHVGAPARPATTFNFSNGQGNYTPSTAQINYCDDRVIGVNRTTTAYGDDLTLLDAVDRPVDGRLMYLSEPLTEDVLLSGTVVVHLQMAPTKGMGNLTVALVEIGRKSRVAVRIESVVAGNYTPARKDAFPLENGAAAAVAYPYHNPAAVSVNSNAPYSLDDPLITPANPSNFKYVTWGHTDVQNPSYDGKAWFEVPDQNYTPNFYFQTTALVPGQYYDYVVELNPYNYVFEKGMQMGIMVYGTDVMASPSITAASACGFDVKLGAGSYIRIPLNKKPSIEATPDTAIEEVVEVIEEVIE